MKLVVIIFIVVMVILFGGLFLSIQDAIENNEEREKCEKILTCEKYSCLEEFSYSASWKNNYLLQEQNCLLKEAKGK